MKLLLPGSLTRNTRSNKMKSKSVSAKLIDLEARLKQTSSVAVSEEEDSECSASCCQIEQSTLDYPKWVACDHCGRWFHLFCIQKKRVPKNFFCDECLYV